MCSRLAAPLLPALVCHAIVRALQGTTTCRCSRLRGQWSSSHTSRKRCAWWTNCARLASFQLANCLLLSFVFLFCHSLYSIHHDFTTHDRRALSCLKPWPAHAASRHSHRSTETSGRSRVSVVPKARPAAAHASRSDCRSFEQTLLMYGDRKGERREQLGIKFGAWAARCTDREEGARVSCCA